LASQYASKIYLLVRGNKMRAEPINQERLNDVADKVQVLYETEVVEILGDDSFHGVRLSNPHEGKETLSVAALFVEIGAIPSTKLAREVGANLDPLGYVEVSNMMETNVPGFYACGDTTNFFGAFKQTITSAAMGTVAVTSAYDYIKKNGTNLCRVHWKPTTNTPGPTS